MIKNAIRPMNSNKNKLNSEIIFVFNLHPDVHLMVEIICCHRPLNLVENSKHYKFKKRKRKDRRNIFFHVL